MNFEKLKIVTAAGFISILSLSAQAGGIHCDDDPKCVPCIPGATCHNSAFILSNQSKLDAALNLLIFQARSRNLDLASVIVSVSVRLSKPVANPDYRELLGLGLGQDRAVLFLTTTLGGIEEISAIPEVVKISATSQMGLKAKQILPQNP